MRAREGERGRGMERGGERERERGCMPFRRQATVTLGTWECEGVCVKYLCVYSYSCLCVCIHVCTCTCSVCAYRSVCPLADKIFTTT